MEVDLNKALDEGEELQLEPEEDLPEDAGEHLKAQWKKKQQWQKWSKDVIPGMLEPYISLLCETDSLQDLTAACNHKLRSGLCVISCVMFLQLIHLLGTEIKKEPALQLLSLGLFPCAPLQPTLAVDLNMLDLVQQLFLNSAPNVTAWSETLEGFLSAQKFKLTTRVKFYQAGPQPQAEGHTATEGGGEGGNTIRPSEYLQERCPLCFGGKNWHQPYELIDAIVCIDACFTQKCCKSQGKAWSAPHEHPETIFVPPEDVATMQAIQVDCYEPGMKVSAAVLDECFESFEAADSNHVKASIKFFADTGLMGLLCCHDQVLWLVGVLYDIGCQLHCSCIKNGFLENILDRIIFGISWPCQIIYHPHKCPGFGLTDGEGCECFWSFIKSLIPSLHVSGYHTCIYTIDTKTTMERKAEAAETLAFIHSKGITEDLLRVQWVDQVNEQTKPLSRQSKNLADKEIQSILALKGQLEEYENEIASYEDMLTDDDPDMSIDEIQEVINGLKNKLKNVGKAVKEKMNRLSVDDQANLKKLVGNNFLIRDQLRQHKFELESLEKSYHKTAHAGQQLKCKEPGIQNLAYKYNKLCQELEKLIQTKHAPQGARVPPQIELNGLFKLDVDDDIWQDIGLTNEFDGSMAIPDWLENDHVHKGIKALLFLTIVWRRNVA
ncbi:hypothetical protein CPB84DRAFT_1818988 [Gymnopilus junonius]|uniref:Uncharacterized protein n=1 Tax=Gymnopilus junonius TaxID=109634 RepID=A0A9P5N6K7_GYMJU|nr:hypothetical protein CPB84DRAFT_1818988 [Gymnopilus junonius]